MWRILVRETHITFFASKEALFSLIASSVCDLKIVVQRLMLQTGNLQCFHLPTLSLCLLHHQIETSNRSIIPERGHPLKGGLTATKYWLFFEKQKQIRIFLNEVASSCQTGVFLPLPHCWNMALKQRDVVDIPGKYLYCQKKVGVSLSVWVLQTVVDFKYTVYSRSVQRKSACPLTLCLCILKWFLRIL